VTTKPLLVVRGAWGADVGASAAVMWA
jgi:hypothetical protein